MTKSMGSGTAWAIGTAATVIVIAGGILIARSGLLVSSAPDVLNRALEQQQGVTDQQTETGVETPPASSLQEPVSEPSAGEDVAVQLPEDGAATQSESFLLSAPVLDLVRVETDGNALVAGSATPGSSVAVVLDGTEVAVTEVPEGGEFVAFLTVEAKQSPQVLSLVARFAGQSAVSEASFILAPMAPVSDRVASGAETDATGESPADALAEARQSSGQPETSGAVVDLVGTPVEVTEAPAAPEQDQNALESDTQIAESRVDNSGAAANEARVPAEIVELAENTTEQSLAEATSSAPPVVAEETVVELTPQQSPEAAAPELNLADEVTPQESAEQADAQLSDTERVEGAQNENLVAKAQPSQVSEVASSRDTVTSAETQSAPKPETVDAPIATAEGEEVATEFPFTPAEDVSSVADGSLATAQPTAEGDRSGDTPAEADAVPAPNPGVSVAILRADNDGVTLVQPASPVAPELSGKVTLDTISYSDAGDVLLAGRARPDALVRIYLDNRPVADLRALEDGTWSGRLSEIAPGIYTLRVDEIDPVEGKVLSRVETPFKREAPEVLNPTLASDADPDEKPAGPAPSIRAVTVQQGDTLWAISNQRYGSGVLYVRVFEANKDAIKDPDLIYPGQIFTLPE